MIARCSFFSDLSAVKHLACTPTPCYCNTVTVLPAADQYVGLTNRCQGTRSMVSFYITHTGIYRSSQLNIWNGTHDSCCAPNQWFAFFNHMHTQMHIWACMGGIMLNWFRGVLSEISNKKVSLRWATESKHINSSHHTTLLDYIYTAQSNKWNFTKSTVSYCVISCCIVS